MKNLHRPDLYCWSVFDEARNIDFNSFLWVRAAGNIAIDPLPMSAHDQAHLEELGGISWIIITNSDHIRAAQELSEKWNAQIAGPRAEAETFPFACERWLEGGNPFAPGLDVLEMRGSKTPGELALLLDNSILITGDLIRAHHAGRLMLLPDPKLRDKTQAMESLREVANLPNIDAVLVGDGWCVFREGSERLRACLRAAEA